MVTLSLPYGASDCAAVAAASVTIKAPATMPANVSVLMPPPPMRRRPTHEPCLPGNLGYSAGDAGKLRRGGLRGGNLGAAPVSERLLAEREGAAGRRQLERRAGDRDGTLSAEDREVVGIERCATAVRLR